LEELVRAETQRTAKNAKIVTDKIELIGVAGIPEVAEGDDVGVLIVRALRDAGS
jgi:hypothetical protein